MLKTLTIHDYALIDTIQVSFGPGLNILTGETGVGKSIILGAVGLLLGERVRSNLIRQGADKAVVEGLFDTPSNLVPILKNADIDIWNDGLLLRREILASGRSRCFANDTPITNAVLKNLGDLLIDLHGQHEHQSILKSDRHLAILDSFADSRIPLQQVKDTVRRFRSIEAELAALRQKTAVSKAQRELLAFQVSEIAKIDPQVGEDTKLESEEKVLRNGERITQLSEALEADLYTGDDSVSERLARAEQALKDLEDVHPVFSGWSQSCASARITAEDVASSLRDYVSHMDFDPDHLDALRERLSALSHLKKKYGGSLESVLAFRKTSQSELDQMESTDEEMDRLTSELELVRKEMTGACMALSHQRHETASRLEKEVVAVLRELGLANSIFQVRLNVRPGPQGPVVMDGQPVRVSDSGIDTAAFFVSLNPGEDPKLLIDVASGGEISRIMLALKTVLAESDAIPVLIFDEIDTGISGRIARVVGKKLKTVATKRQVICITHLPQIASLGQIHFAVEKEVQDGRSRTSIRQLNKQDRVREIAKLLGGESVTENTLDSARDLLEGDR